MKLNMGQADRIIRAVIAVAVAVLIIVGVLKGALAIILGIVGGIFLITAIVGLCPLYLPFGISTRKKAATQE